MKQGGFSKAERLTPYSRETKKVDFVVMQAGEKFAVVPDFVARRLDHHRHVGTSPAGGAKLLRLSKGSFTRAVLPWRFTWLSGQGIEGGLRAGLQGAGPVSYRRANLIKQAMNDVRPGSGDALFDRAVPAGKIGKVVKDFAGERKTFAGEFPDSSIAQTLTRLGRTPGFKQVRDLNNSVTTFIFDQVNGKLLEGVPQTAMLGRALKASPLLDRQIIGLSDKALRDAAEGLQDTAAMNQLARHVQRGYGKYSSFSPAMREMIVHWTPFVPWSLNAIKFLTSVLPKDHPVVSSLIASANVMEEDWRKAHRLSTKTSNKLPFFDMGSYPISGDKSVLRIGHYTPFGVSADPSGGLGDMILPQFSGLYGALKYGVDWKGQPLEHEDHSPYSGPETWLYGLTQLATAMVPLSSQASNVIKAKDKPKALKHEFRILSTTRIKPEDAKKDPLADKYGLGGGSDLDGLAKKYGIDTGSNLDDLAKKYGVGGR
jgi:hypothetical protein